MKLGYLTETALHTFIDRAIAEDVGNGDHSSLAAIPADTISNAQLLIKEEGILAGVEIAKMIFTRFDPSLTLLHLKQDGDRVIKGDIAFTVSGSARSILTCERLVLNCMQRMSGIATYTTKLSALINYTHCKLLDTRKTTPNFRLMEKWAVSIGGGVNHRFGLYDMVMLKDNHIDFAGGVAAAIKATKTYLASLQKTLKIEVEARSFQEVTEILEVGGVDIIMLDNMNTEDMKASIKLIGDKCQTEASGGITEANIREIADCGVDFISVGALTHSAKSIDMSLKAIGRS